MILANNCRKSFLYFLYLCGNDRVTSFAKIPPSQSVRPGSNQPPKNTWRKLIALSVIQRWLHNFHRNSARKSSRLCLLTLFKNMKKKRRDNVYYSGHSLQNLIRS